MRCGNGYSELFELRCLKRPSPRQVNGGRSGKIGNTRNLRSSPSKGAAMYFKLCCTPNGNKIQMRKKHQSCSCARDTRTGQELGRTAELQQQQQQPTAPNGKPGKPRERQHPDLLHACACSGCSGLRSPTAKEPLDSRRVREKAWSGVPDGVFHVLVTRTGIHRPGLRLHRARAHPRRRGKEVFFQLY